MSLLIGSVLLAAIILFYNQKRNKPTEVAGEKVLAMANDSVIKGMDPVRAEDLYMAREVSKVYEGLMEFHYLKRPFELSPNLAAAMPTVSEDQLVYTFKIREGVLFQDDACFPDKKGRELTAADFVYALKRLADPKIQSSGFWLVDGRIKGLNEWRERNEAADTVDYDQEIEGLKALDKYTLQITLTAPYPQILYALTMPQSFVVAHEAVSYYGDDFMNHPVGTGPFVLKKFSIQDSTLVYHKNPTFRDKFFPTEAADEYQYMLDEYAGKKLPFVDKIVVSILPEVHPRWLQFQGGQIDTIEVSKTKLATEVLVDSGLPEELQKQEVQLFASPSVETSYIVFNVEHPVFKDNLKLRQAMSLAFDAARYNELFFNSKAVAAQSTIPPGLAGYKADYKNPYLTYNISKAKEYLAAAGYPAGKGLPIITLEVASTTDNKQKGEFFQRCMAQIGIRVQLVENLFPVLINKILQKSTMLHTLSWNGDYPDAENFLQLFYGPIQPSGLGSNMHHNMFDALYKKASVLQDSSVRTELYEQMNQIVAEYVPAIYTTHSLHVALQHSWLRNYCWSNFHDGTVLYWDIDVDKKQEMIASFNQSK